MANALWFTDGMKEGWRKWNMIVCLCLSVFELNRDCETGKGSERRETWYMWNSSQGEKGVEEMWGPYFVMPSLGKCLFLTTLTVIHGELGDAATWSCGVFVTQGTPVLFGKEDRCGWNLPGETFRMPLPYEKLVLEWNRHPSQSSFLVWSAHTPLPLLQDNTLSCHFWILLSSAVLLPCSMCG